jgi:hypothetical protein
LLSGVAAVLAASLSIGGVGASPAVPDAAATMSRIAGITSLDVDLTPLRGITGVSLLSGLSQLSLGDLGAYVAEYPTQIEGLLAAPPAAAKVSGWWGALRPAERASLLAGAPRVVGNLEGIPFRERSRANLRYLGQTIADAETELEDAADPVAQERLIRELAVLGEVRKSLQPSPGGPKRSLVLLDTEGGGRAAIALGNPDTARYVDYLVPGMNHGVQEQIVNWSATAEALYTEQVAVLDEHRKTRPTDAAGSVATIAWIGYQTPDLFSVGGLDRAERGADMLERSWLGLQSSRTGDDPFLSVFAHSYGSTVSLVALSRGSVGVDAFVMVGSPGSAVQSVDSLDVPAANVYVGEADWDPAVNSAFFGSDPGAASYGARTLGVTGATDPLTGRWLEGSVGHNEYFKPGSESLHNMALIGTDNGRLVTNGSE